MIKHIAIKDSDDSYFQNLTENTLILCSEEAFLDIVNMLHSSHTIFINENDEEFAPNLRLKEAHFHQFIKNGNQTIKFFRFSSSWSIDNYKNLLATFMSHIKSREDIWFCPRIHKTINGTETFDHEIVAFTEFKEYETFSNRGISRGIYSGRFGFLFPDSVWEESLKIHEF